ncbi:MAG: DnaJ domain-containing protein [Gammaproteobacteria bacterium]
MIRIYLVILLIVLVCFGVYRFNRMPLPLRRRYSKILMLSVAGIFILFLGAAGRLSWLITLIALLLALAARLLPVLSHFAPLLQKLWVSFNRGGRHTAGQDGRHQSDAKMSVDEAYAVLGLKKEATRQEIIDAHRRLIQKMHPDRGGTDYFAAKINLAKEMLLKR